MTRAAESHLAHSQTWLCKTDESNQSGSLRYGKRDRTEIYIKAGGGLQVVVEEVISTASIIQTALSTQPDSLIFYPRLKSQRFKNHNSTCFKISLLGLSCSQLLQVSNTAPVQSKCNNVLNADV